MAELFDFNDDLGPAKVVGIYEPRLPLKAIVVVDNVAAGPAIGGVRMAKDVSLAECFRLARAMTLKNAAAGLPHGGGKSVIFADPSMTSTQKQKVVRSFARAIGQITDYIVGPDMGTNEECMAWVFDEIGRSVGLPREIGGIPLDEIGATGFGVAVAAEAVEETGRLLLEGARVAVQGYGAVGQHAARALQARGSIIVAISDSQGAILNNAGLNLDDLDHHKSISGSVRDFPDADAIQPADLVAVDCDIWIPAARPDVINRSNVDRLRAKVILQGANIPVTRDAEQLLHDRGVLSVPDFIANAGGVICAAVEYQGGTERQAFDAIAERTRRNTLEILSQSKKTGLDPRKAAERMAVARVKIAMGFRRP
ncbi:MAG: Glu/Leu/Phe/Val family dehydrogenase [Hyphomicrobiaceae bacterium]